MTTKTAAATLSGGLDQVSPQLSIQPGRVVDAQNYEALPRGGYKRTDGFARFSGGWTLPHNRELDQFLIVRLDRSQAIYTPPSDVALIGSESGGVGYATLRIGDITILSDGTSLWPFVMIHNEYQVGDRLIANGIDYGTVAGLGIPENETLSPKELSLIMIRQMASSYKALVLEVPGTGPIQGVHMFKGYVFTVREWTDGYDRLWVQSEWLGEVHGATPGDWRESGVSGGQHLVKNGRYEFINYNFTGHEADQIMVGVNGVNQAFFVELNSPGTPLIQYINTGMTHDVPTHVAAFKGHLFLSFSGGSLQHSSINNHTTWSAVTGATELTTGEEITALKVLAGNALGIFCKTKVLILYGTSAADWQLEVYTDAIGALQGTAQNMAAMTLFADERGITQLQAAQEYGDFASSMLSHDFDPLFRSTIRNYVASTVNKTKSQYRIFSSDGKALFLTFDRNQLAGAMPMNLGIPVSCACSGEDADGNDRTFFGSTDGYVYELDAGYSFDGEPIEHWIRTPFNHFKSPRQKKRFRKLVLDLDSDANAQLQVRPEFAYGSKDIADHRVEHIEINEGAQIFENGENAFSFDYEPVTDGEVFIAGTGINIGITIYGKSAEELPHTIYGLIYHYTPRALKR